MDIEKILNKRSNAVVTDGGGVETPVKPTSSQLDNGEIAVNYHKGTERLFIKNDNDEVVEFVSKDEVDKKLDRNSTGPTSNTNGSTVISTSENGHKVSYDNDNEIENQGLNIRFKNGSAPNLFLEAGGVSSDHLSVHRNQGSGISAFTKALAYVDDIPSVTPQVQSDWNETDETSKGFIKNKPTIPTKTSDLTNDSGFVSDETIEPLTEQFSTYKSVYETLYDYDNFIKGPLALTGEWERTDYPSSGTYVFETYNKTFGIRIDNKVENAGFIYFNTYHDEYQGSTPVQLMVEGDVVYSYLLRNDSSSQLGLYITNNNGTLTITINHYSESGGTITIPPGEITVIFPEDANIRYTTLLISSNYSISYLVSEGITKQLNLVAFSGSYNDLNDTPAPPTLPTKLSELTDDIRIYLSISEWVSVAGEQIYTSSAYADDAKNKLYISSDNSFNNHNTTVSINSDNRLQVVTHNNSGGNYNRICGYAPYVGTLVIIVRSDSQNSFLNHKWYINNGSNGINGAKQYSVNVGVGSIQKYIFYVEKGEFSIMTDVALSPSSTIVFNTISLIPTLAGLDREASQYSPGYISAADKTKLDGIATGATANIGTVTGIKINNVTKTPTNGTVDLGTVLTSTTSSVANGSKIPITSDGVYTTLQNYLTRSNADSTYEKKMSFTSVSSLPSTCVINTYYRITSNITSLAIKLPNSSLTAGDTIGISFTAGSSITTPTVSGGTIYKQDGWSDFFEANATYEIVALYDGGKWLVTSTKFNS